MIFFDTGSILEPNFNISFMPTCRIAISNSSGVMWYTSSFGVAPGKNFYTPLDLINFLLKSRVLISFDMLSPNITASLYAQIVYLYRTFNLKQLADSVDLLGLLDLLE